MKINDIISESSQDVLDGMYKIVLRAGPSYLVIKKINDNEWFTQETFASGRRLGPPGLDSRKDMEDFQKNHYERVGDLPKKFQTIPKAILNQIRSDADWYKNLQQ